MRKPLAPVLTGVARRRGYGDPSPALVRHLRGVMLDFILEHLKPESR